MKLAHVAARHAGKTLCASLAFFTLVGCTSLPSSPAPHAADAGATDGKALTLDKLYNASTYHAGGVPPTRWLADGSGYTTLEESAVADGHDLVRYHPETQAREIVISATELTPTGHAEPLTLADYHWSNDGAKLLIFTNTKRSWRTHTLGDYWVFDLSTRKLQQLGQFAEPSTLQFAKF